MPTRRIAASTVFLLLLFIAIPLRPQESRRVLATLLQAYPNKISKLTLQNGDWSILVNGKTIYWSDGRLLPTKAHELDSQYTPYQFHPYPATMPPIRQISPEEQRRLDGIIHRQESRQSYRNQAFPIALWGMENHQIAEQTVQIITFMNKNIRVHPDIIGQLTLIEKEIMRLATENNPVRNWMNSLYSIDAYVWREIAGSANRSLHSFGIAIDLIPDSYGDKHVYWRWSRKNHALWWTIPYNNRYFPPPEVIQVFENHGFIWGGKWLFFDQIHFEYRPELFDDTLHSGKATVHRNYH